MASDRGVPPARQEDRAQEGPGRGDALHRDRVGPHRELVASILTRGIDQGEFRRDLDVGSIADVICQLQSDYSGRAYRNDRDFPDDPKIIDAAIAMIVSSVRD